MSFYTQFAMSLKSGFFLTLISALVQVIIIFVYAVVIAS